MEDAVAGATPMRMVKKKKDAKKEPGQLLRSGGGLRAGKGLHFGFR